MKKLFTFVALICSFLKISAAEIESHLLLDSPDGNHKIEIMIQNPSLQEAPLLLFLHGTSSGKGLNSISDSWFKHWLDKGYAVAAISMPGYGGSTGKKDFCGPFTMNSLNFAIDAIKDKIHVLNFGMIGFGQGGLASVLLASQRTDVQCVVCSNGGYDLLRHKVAGDALMRILQKNDYDLDVEDDSALAARSAILHTTSIDAPVFLLHRKGNPIVGEEEVVDFYHAMLAVEKECYLTLKEKTLEVDAQKLTYEEVLAETEEWVDCNMQK